MTEAKLLPSLNEIVADLFPVLLKTIWGHLLSLSFVALAFFRYSEVSLI